MNEKLRIALDNLITFFTQRKFTALKNIVRDLDPIDIAFFIENELDEKEQLLFFRLLPKELASDVFIEIETDTQEKLIKAFTDKELKAVIDDMFVADTVDVIEEMPANVVNRILKNADPENRKQINALLEYPDDSAGSIMTTEYVSLSTELTIEDAFDKIRRIGVNKKTVYTCYVTDNKKKLIGVVTVKDMLLSPKNELIANIMNQNVICAFTLDDKEQVALTFSKYGYLALPVVDKEYRLVGIVTSADAVDVIKEEATEDIHKMAAIVPTEKPYFKQSIFSIWKARAPWLLLLMLSATFTSMVLSRYEAGLSAVLYAFVPMLMGTAGNAGNQSSATIIRAIALGEIQFKDALKVIAKEIATAIILGLTVATICFLKLYFIDSLYNDVTIHIALVVSGVLFLTIMIGKLVGCMLPLLAKKLHLDPAVVAGPFMSTIVDVLSLLCYCSACIYLL